MFLEDKFDNVRKRISVRVTKARKGTDAFTIVYRGKEPEKVMKVVNTLATYFINENLKVRESQAVGTSDFLDDERGMMKKRLERVENALRMYRKEHMGELPEQLNSNLRILEKFQEQVNERRERLGEIRKGLVELKERYSFAKNLPSTGGAVKPEAGEFSTLEQMKQQLLQLQSRYTDRHPDINRLERMIAKHESTPGNVSEKNKGGSTERKQLSRQELMELSYNSQVKDMQQEINEVTRDISELQKQISIYKVRVEATPKREQELMSLKRDYQNIQGAYSSLVNRKLEAEIAVNMERKQKGERFRILDSARLPQKPVSPDMKRLFILTLAAGLGLGGGVIFLLEYLNTSFRSPEDLESYLKIPVLATVPKINHLNDIRRNRINQTLSIVSIMIAGILFAGFAALTLKGVDKTIGLIKKIVPI